MLGLAVIGTGHWGKNHARACGELMSAGTIDSLKICDADETRSRELGQTLGVPWETSYRGLLQDSSIQAIIVATPSKTHYQIAKEAMESGKDVLVEKPMTMDVHEASALVEVASRFKRILMVGHIFRYHPAVQELKRRIDAGEIGDIQNMIGIRLYFGLPRRDMGVIYALGIHELDLFCFLMDVPYPMSMFASGTNTYAQGTEETASIVMDFGHTKGYVFDSWLVAAYGKMRDLVVVGSKRTARVDYLKPQELQLFDTQIVTQAGIPTSLKDGGRRPISLPYAEPLKEEIRHFIQCVVSRQPPLTDGLVGLRGVIMAEAALRSAANGTQVALP